MNIFCYTGNPPDGKLVNSSFKPEHQCPAWDYFAHSAHNLFDERNIFDDDNLPRLHLFATNYIQKGYLNNNLENGCAWYLLDNDKTFTITKPPTLSALIHKEKEMIQEVKVQNQPRQIKL